MILQPWVRRWIVLGILAATLPAMESRSAAAQSRTDADEAALAARTRRIQAQILTLDSHVDVVLPSAASEQGSVEAQQASFEQLVRGGIDHVGIGSDFNHGAGIVGFEDEGEAPNVTLELARRGCDRDQIAKIWGGNFLRVFAKVQAVSQQLQKS